MLWLLLATAPLALLVLLLLIRHFRRLGMYWQWQGSRQRYEVSWHPLFGASRRLYYVREISARELNDLKIGRRVGRAKPFTKPHVAVFAAQDGRLVGVRPDFDEARYFVSHLVLKRGRPQLARLMPEPESSERGALRYVQRR